MTTAVFSSPPAPLPHYHRPPPSHHHHTTTPRPPQYHHRDEEEYYDESYASSSSSSASSSYMQNHPPLRSRISATAVPRCNPPIPPSLLDSPLVVSPNSPFRRDHAFTPSAPSYSTGHDRLNLLDTVPMGSSSRASGYGSGAEPAPDDIGVAGTPKSARSSSINYRSTPMRPPMGRGNSWLQQQPSQSCPSSSSMPPPPPQSSSTQSALKLPSRLPINTPYPPGQRTGYGSSISGAPTSSAGRPS